MSSSIPVQQFRQIVARYPAVGNILFYPHPLHMGGLVLIATAEKEAWLELIGAAQRLLPEGLCLHCLRPYELSLLGQPGIFAPPLSVNEFPHLLYWLKHHGVVLFGEDIRPTLPSLSVPPAQLLAAHIEACTDTFRRYGILPQLIGGQFERLFSMLALEMRRLMATALLLHQEWEVDLQTVPEHFHRYFPEAELLNIHRRLEELGSSTNGRLPITEPIACEGVWLFEKFLARLETVTQCS